ncbi:MAG: xanthine dehydrogenase family protein molybdopterin-binding subunit [Jannaschia sp.]
MSDPLRGTALYTADVDASDALHVAFLRSDHAHAKLRHLETETAKSIPGVFAVLTSDDLGPLGSFPAFLLQPTADGRPLIVPRRPVLSEGKVRYVGELIAMVVAETHSAAMDGVEALAPDYDTLPTVVGLDGAGLTADIHPEAPGNLAARLDLGDTEGVSVAMGMAAVVVETQVQTPRVSPVPMEPMAALAAYDRDTGIFDLWTPHQGIAEQRRDICAVLGIRPGAVRVRAEKVGGAFGVRGAAFPETVALLAAARKLGRRLRWQASRSEGFLADYHGRGMRLTGRLAMDANHRFTALDVEIEADLGAYVHPVGAHISVNNTFATLTGCYVISRIAARYALRFTNAVPVGPFRGAGRPDMALLIERLVDEAATATGLDPLELRRLNVVSPDMFPYLTPMGSRYDSGDYPGLLSRARHAAGWEGFSARADADRARGLLRGIGAALFVEVAGGGGAARDSVRLDVTSENGSARIAISTTTQSTGQDHDGLFRGLLSSQLGLPGSALNLVQSEPDDTPEGVGSFASRTTVQAGSALHNAGNALIAHLIAAEAARCGLPTDDLVGDNQSIRERSGRVISTLAAALDRVARLGTFAITDSAPVVQTFPSGCHIAEVQIDPETGFLTVLNYVAVDDAGRTMSLHAVEGQLRGGIAQGLSGALMEGHRYDETGQLISASLMDYPLPRFADLPPVDLHLHDIASPTNPLGVKGVGEAGMTGALGAIVNATADALRRAGASLPPLPLSAPALWHALRDRGKD